jgi:lipoate-protein ligase A
VHPQPPKQPRPGDGGWSVEHRVGGAEQLHHHDVAPQRCLIVCQVERPALVIGSTQDVATVDGAALRRAGVELARRRSGGGAVLLVPGEHVWVDLVVPAGDPLWVDDVEAATWWVGETFARVVQRLVGPAGSDRERGGVQVHRRGVSDRAAGRLVCFGAAGPGEVLVGGAKLVGISQRRTRDAARFQCVLHRRWRPGATLELLAARAVDAVEGLRSTLDERVTSLERIGPVPTTAEPGWSVVEELLAQLP